MFFEITENLTAETPEIALICLVAFPWASKIRA